jgi:hypothetical protein
VVAFVLVRPHELEAAEPTQAPELAA